VPIRRDWHNAITAVKTRVQVFTRAPVSGQAKTRLIPRLGANGAASLQMRLTEHALSIAVAAGLGPVELWCSPDCTHPAFRTVADQGIVLHDQGSGNIGDRMHRALSQALLAGDAAVLIGSDCPSLCPQDLQDAAQALHNKKDFAFVPAEDGGYVLIAAATNEPRSLRRAFDSIDWGTENVMAQTRERLRECGRTWHELTSRWDIDRPEDYDRLMREQPGFLTAKQ